MNKNKKWFVLLGVVLLVTAVTARQAYTGQEEQIHEGYLKVHSEKDAKHTPHIKAPKKVKAGEWFEVTVWLEGHPSMSAHSIHWIALYAGDVELSRVQLHPVMSKPKVTFTIALPESTTLRALAMPNHNGPFESSQAIKVTPAAPTTQKN